ncbi:MAG TPA: ComF family protein [Bryobacteraceae bacterium]|nr:ComF family protein [Bryobacteraceae bacterium]
MFNLVFPDECRVCEKTLHEFSRVPVCSACLQDSKPLLADYFCIDCKTPFLNASPLDENGRCGLCRRGLTGFDATYSFGEYEGTLRKLIHLFKYSHMQPLAKPLGKMLLSVLPRENRYDMVVPMPLHWLRRWKRGFNQSQLLARVVAGRLGTPLVSALRRKRATLPQAGLSNAQRRSNVAGAFVVRKRAIVKDRHILLVDDVMTTGATLAASASALKRAGASRITVLTVARVDRRKSSGAANASVT